MGERICSIEGCKKAATGGRGWCQMHYMRWWKHGDPHARKMIFGSAEERLGHYVEKRGPNECWPWKGGLRDGYGAAWDGQRPTSAHLLAYKLWVGPIPEGMTLDHMCHDPAFCTPGKSCPHRRCCNPAHLKVASGADNSLRGGSEWANNARKTECPKGHPYDEVNTYWRYRRGSGGAMYWGRECRVCRHAQASAKRARRRDERLQGYAA